MQSSNYKFSNEEELSGYESENGTSYIDEFNVIGRGSYALVREFLDENHVKPSKAVLSPAPDSEVDLEEVKVKFNFLQTIYPHFPMQLIMKDNTYRLVMPVIPGIAYYDLFFVTQFSEKEQIQLFLSAVNALTLSHEKNYVVVDLNSHNIHFHEKSTISYLVDGGMARKSGQMIHHYFQDDSGLLSPDQFPFIAPECWCKKGAIAKKSMDIWSLGEIMNAGFGDDASPQIKELIILCKKINPEERPDLKTLKKSLEKLYNQYTIKSKNTLNTRKFKLHE